MRKVCTNDSNRSFDTRVRLEYERRRGSLRSRAFLHSKLELIRIICNELFSRKHCRYSSPLFASRATTKRKEARAIALNSNGKRLAFPAVNFFRPLIAKSISALPYLAWPDLSFLLSYIPLRSHVSLVFYFTPSFFLTSFPRVLFVRHCTIFSTLIQKSRYPDF